MIRKQFLTLTYFNKSDRDWELSFGAAFSVGVPLLIGAYLNQMIYSLVVSSGALVFLYTTHTPIYHRMLVMMAASFGFIVSFILGSISHFSSAFIAFSLGMIATLGAVICRYYQLNAPGNFFFIMIATLAAFMPFGIDKFPFYAGLISIGCIFACIVAFIYSIVTINKIKIKPILAHEYKGFSEVITDPFIIGIFVSISILCASFLGLDKPYWVPISCIATMQGMTLLGTWIRHIHRIFGTFVGLGLTWILFQFNLNNYEIALIIMLLTFLSDYFIGRNYAIASIFVTPLTILLAETSGVFTGSENNLIISRLLDILLGSSIGVIGGLCLHNQKFRLLIENILKRVLLKKD